MAGSKMVSSALAKRYARALVDLAEENKTLAKVESDLGALYALLAESADFSFFVKAASISAKRQQAVIADLAAKAKFQVETRNFLNVLSVNGRLAALPSMIQAVFDLLAQRRGEVSATVESAHVLSAAQQKALRDELSAATGYKILLDAQVDEALIGGLVVTIGSRRVDSSVAGRLERLKALMSKSSVDMTNDNIERLNNKKEA